MFRVEEQIVLLCFMLEAISSVKVYMKQHMSKKCGHQIKETGKCIIEDQGAFPTYSNKGQEQGQGFRFELCVPHLQSWHNLDPSQRYAEAEFNTT